MEFIVSENEYDVVNSYPALDLECAALLAGAVPTPAGISLRAIRRDWKIFAEWLASEANEEVNRKRERVLDTVLRRLEGMGLF